MKHEQISRTLSATEIWDVSANTLHTPEYRKAYISAITPVIGSKNARILDTACGTGFPTTDLYEAGFQNITCADASQDSLDILDARLKAKGIVLPSKQATWQKLNEAFEPDFDVLINLDNSLVYMDTWSHEEPMAEGTEAVLKRIEFVVQNFYDCLKEGGRGIVGRGGPFDINLKERTQNIGESEYEGRKAEVEWHLRYDWEKRHRNWTIKTWVDDVPQPNLSYKSYIISKEELAKIFNKIGFKNVVVIPPPGHGIYDDILVGEK